MKKILISAVMLASAVAGAQAADLPPRHAPPPPPVMYSPASAFSWTGFYAGANLGFGWMDKFNRGATVAATAFGPVQLADPHGGVVIGPQVGFNYQVSPMFVVGVEGDVQATTIGGGVVSRKTPIVGTLRGRLGVTPFNPSTMIYITGGAALASLDIGPSPNGLFPKLSHVGKGWAVGGGVEYAINDAWSTKLEYLYTNLGADYQTAPGVTTAQRVSNHMIRIGVNYRFNSFGGGLATVR